MRTEELNYDLPEELIAQLPTNRRSDSRLLVYNRGSEELADSRFSQIGEFLRAGDCLVLNDTKVLRARFYGRRASGARLEGLFISEQTSGLWRVMLKRLRRVRQGERIYLQDRKGQDYCRAEVVEKLGVGLCRLKVEAEGSAELVLGEIGFAPLPPYIKRDTDEELAVMDLQRYQTVYARREGAVAAPTAGMHFTEELIELLRDLGIRFAYVTLHVGPGTFRPIVSERLEEHDMEGESFKIDEENAGIVNECKAAGRRVIAVGTTSVRVVESVARQDEVKACQGQTELFIKPGFEFQVVDAIVTNFHLPKSTLLALVASFCGLEEILRVYRYAVEQRYRFYSYGDAMLIL